MAGQCCDGVGGSVGRGCGGGAVSGVRWQAGMGQESKQRVRLVTKNTINNRLRFTVKHFTGVVPMIDQNRSSVGFRKRLSA